MLSDHNYIRQTAIHLLIAIFISTAITKHQNSITSSSFTVENLLLSCTILCLGWSG